MKKLSKKSLAQLVKIQALLAEHLGIEVSQDVAIQFKKDFEARAALGFAAPDAVEAQAIKTSETLVVETPKASDKAKKKAWSTPEERLAFLSKAREEHFKKMGFGPYAPKKSEAAPAKTKAEKDAALAIARDAYFKLHGYGPYKPAAKPSDAKDANASSVVARMILIVGGKKKA